MTEQVQIYDTTLRDGMQGEGMSLSADEKLRVAHAIDGLGVHLIEAGFLDSNPKDAEVFQLLERETFQHAELAAFGMTRRRGTAAEDDPALRMLADSFAPVCTLVGKTWRLHLEKVTKVDPEENLAMIADSVGFLRSRGKRVVYDAEHFFDGFRNDPEYAMRCLRASPPEEAVPHRHSPHRLDQHAVHHFALHPVAQIRNVVLTPHQVAAVRRFRRAWPH